MGTKRCSRLTAAEKLERALLLATAAAASAIAGVQLTADESILLHKRVADLVCSWRWEQDLVRMVNDGDVPLRQRRHEQIRAFHDAGIYPPGGSESAMIICTCCRCPMPPCVVGSVGICWECYQLNLAEGASAQQPSAPRFVWMVPDKKALSLLGEGFQLSRSRSRPPYRTDDPRVVGGKIDADGIMHDPWMGDTGTPLPAAAVA